MALVAPNEPLVLRDGTKIDPMTGNVIREDANIVKQTIAELASSQAPITVKQAKRTTDLPDPTSKMNVIAVVAAYKLYGLVDADIAAVTNIQYSTLLDITSSDAYIAFYNDILAALRDGLSTSVREKLASSADLAADKLLQMMSSPDEKVAFAAAKDVLDRSGNSAAAIVEHRHSMSNGLVIEVVTRDTTKQVPTIDLTATDVTDA